MDERVRRAGEEALIERAERQEREPLTTPDRPAVPVPHRRAGVLSERRDREDPEERPHCDDRDAVRTQQGLLRSGGVAAGAPKADKSPRAGGRPWDGSE